MHIEDLAKAYLTKTDEELLQLAMDSEQLTSAAQTALTNELARRQINVAERPKVFRDEGNQPRLERRADSAPLSSRDSHRVSEFVKEVLRVYHDHFWLFVKLIAPAVIIGYIAVVIGRYEAREIARRIPWGPQVLEHKTGMLEIFFVNQVEYLVMWLASCLSFGAICSAVRQIGEGAVPSLQDSFAAVRQRMGSFLRLSLLLYFLVLLAVAAASLLAMGVFWGARQRHANLSHFTIQLVAVTTIGLAVLVFSRFALAMPALILDNWGVGQSIFRSDELTERKWLILAVLLAKSLVGGYVAGMGPFWLASWILAGASLPSWFRWLLDTASVAAVIVVEPTMFIGFALLYLEMSALPAVPGDALVVR
jgi:hypothetical protein